jgi:hypothetical protein
MNTQNVYLVVATLFTLEPVSKGEEVIATFEMEGYEKHLVAVVENPSKELRESAKKEGVVGIYSRNYDNTEDIGIMADDQDQTVKKALYAHYQFENK